MKKLIELIRDNFSHVIVVVHHIGVVFGLLLCVCCIGDFVIPGFLNHYIRVLLHTFYCNFGRAEEYGSL